MFRVDIEQRSDEWFQLRTGVPSASMFSKIVTSTGSKSKSLKAYMHQLVGERFAGACDDGYQNAAMLRGIEIEDEAREYYEIMTGRKVEQTGLVFNNEDRQYSCSPDGLCEDRGLEIKCPAMAAHVEYSLHGRVPPVYYQQVQGSMLITGLSKWDFMSYHPLLPAFVVTEPRNDEFCDKLKGALEDFVSEMDEKIKTLKILGW